MNPRPYNGRKCRYNSPTRLTAASIPAIRQAASAGQSRASLATQYGVTYACIHDVLTRRTWGHVE